MFDLETFEFDEAPAFVIRVGATTIEFELLYTNAVFRSGSFRDTILADNREALLFRSWAQALSQPATSRYDCAGRTWSAEMAPKSAMLKVVRATQFFSKDKRAEADLKADLTETFQSVAKSTLSCERTKGDYIRGMIRDRPALPAILPRTNLNARWEGIQTMLDMSDVGVFEYDLNGKLMHANEAYLRLRWVTMLIA